ncbi:DUF2161 family putative PD-(D/E)XK-type phosphodiesterase [Corticibacterium sp. UT-5YL-CI-8]|nr:DUF2161 family putative PD-(D/E)XK-type phosphodiesterase [Tianweitania sp. UT-5YL-CI-8]
MLESDFYHPLKAFMETLGYSVKGEVNGCDLLALREGEPPVLVVCEMKLSFNLELILQGVDRAPACDEVWLAAALSKSGRGREQDARYRNLCRRLGFGLLGIATDGSVHVIVAPFAATPRRDPRRRSRLVEEHRRRIGDPNKGGGNRKPIMTVYRQDCIACATAMLSGAQTPRHLKAIVERAPAILRRNVYGWFVRESRGLYGLSELGRLAVAAASS